MTGAIASRRWETVRRLGQGGGGEVVLATDRWAGDVARAVKRVADPLAAEWLAREAAALVRLRHPGVVRVLGLDRDDDGAPLLVMEHVDGRPLDEAAAGRSEQERVDLLARLLFALGYVHARGVLHLDVKPANVLVRDGRPVLVDFGLSAGEWSDATGGTPAWASPEALAGGSIDRRADLFAIGVIAWELAGGARPFGATLREVRAGHAAPLPAPPAGRLGRFASALLARDPEARPPDARAAIALLAVHGPVPAEGAEERAAFAIVPGALRAELLGRVGGAIAAGRSVLVEGPPGSGRRRVLDEAALGASLAGVQPLRSAKLGGPLGPLLGPLRAAARIAPIEAALDARRLLAHRLGEGAAAESAPNPAALGRAAAALLRAAASARALLLVVDEADTLDPATALALTELAAAGGLPLVASAAGPLPALGATSLPIVPLTAAEVAQHLAGVYPGRSVPASLARDLHRWSGGWPGALESALVALEGAGGPPPGVTGPDSLPAELSGARLPTPAAAAGELARLAREAAPQAAMLLALAPALPLARLARALGIELPAARVEALRLVGAGAGRLEEDGALLVGASSEVLGALEGSLSPAERREAARALRSSLSPERAASDGIERVLLRAEGARLGLIAQAEGAPAEALGAAAELLAASAPREAAALVASALDAGVVPQALGDALVLHGEALSASGRPEEALDAFGRAATAGAGAAALAGRAELLVRRGAYREAAEALQLACEVAPTARRTRLQAQLARTQALAGRPEEALGTAAEALATAAVGSDGARSRSDALGARGLALYLLGRADEALGAYREAEREASTLGDLSRQAVAVNGRAMVAHRRGAADEARGLYEQALALAERGFDLSRCGACHLNLGAIAQEQGDTAAAAAHARQAAAVSRALGDPAAEARAELNLAVLHRFVGRLTEATAAAARGRLAAERAGTPHVGALCRVVEGEARLLSGEAASARTALQQALDSLAGRAELLDAEVTLAECELAAGAPVEAAARAARIAEEARELPSVRARALLASIDAALVRGEASRDGLAKLHEALGLSEGRVRPDLRWRLHRALGRVHRVLGEEGLSALESAIARRLLEDAARALPPGDRAPFSARPDRRAALAELSLLAPRESAGGSSVRLLALNRRLGAERDADRLLESIVDAAMELTAAERGFVLLPGATEALEVRVGRGFDRDKLAGGELPVSRSIAERVYRTGEPELAGDALDDDRYRAQLSIHVMKLRSVLCVPLTFRGERLGALYLDSRLRAKAFGDAEVGLLEAFADQAAIALGNARALAEAEAARSASATAEAEVRRLAAELEHRVERQAAELEAARSALGDATDVAGIIGESPPMQRLFRALRKVAAVEVPVLVQGESGTGKELVARAVHTLGPRRERPFVSVNCSALVETLLESELFGHVRGAFTGADRDRRGLFELADGGTLFLDEVGDMGLAMQAKLLRALQSGEIWKVGGRAPLKVDVRVVAATNKPVPKLVAEGKFREDLYYRLNVVTIEVPPLRDRREDIPLLVSHVLGRIERDGGPKMRIEAKAIEALVAWGWPGNVRELEATLKNAAIFAEGGVIRREDLPITAGARGAATSSAPQTAVGSSSLGLADAELVLIRKALDETGGNKAHAARLLGIDRKTLYNKLRKAGLDPS